MAWGGTYHLAIWKEHRGVPICIINLDHISAFSPLEPKAALAAGEIFALHTSTSEIKHGGSSIFAHRDESVLCRPDL